MAPSRVQVDALLANTGHLTSVCPEILGAAWAAS
jgi:hypothetical protein